MNDSETFIADRAISLKTFLTRRLSQRALKKVKYHGGILVNGIPRTVRYNLEAGDVVTVNYPREDNEIIPWYFPLRILYEDEALMVVSKPVGMASVPVKRYPNHTLTNAIKGYYESQHITSTVHLVSRLDKYTGGLVLVAKTRRVHHLLEHHFERHYRLICAGQVPEHGIISLPIAAIPNTTIRVVSPSGKPAVTHYTRLAYHDGQSLVEAVLETGRTHQIRVHFAFLHHPLIGDRQYGKARPGFSGQALYSTYLSFVHPLTGQTLVFEEIPSLFMALR